MRLLATLQILVTAIGLGAGAALWLLGPRGAVPADRAPLLISLAVGCGLLALVGSVMLRDRRVVAIGTVVLALLAATSAGLFGWLLSRGVGDPVQSWTEPADEGAAFERVRVVWLDLAAEKPSRSDPIRREDRRVDWAWDRGVDLLRSQQADVVVLHGAWNADDRGNLAARLAEELGMHAVFTRTTGSRPLLGAEEGVALLSRYPLRSADRWQLRPAASLLRHRVAVVAEVEHPLYGSITVAAASTPPGDRRVQEAQERDLLARLETRDSPSTPVLLAGLLGLPSNEAAREGGDEWKELAAGEDARLLLRASDWRPLWGTARGADEPPTRTRASPPPSGPGPRLGSASPALIAEMAPVAPPRVSRWPGDWRSVPPASVGMSSARLERAAQEIGQLEGLEFLLVARAGRLVVERYFRGASPDSLHNVKSVSKSVLSAVLGIALEQGHLDLDDPIADYLPQAAALDDPRKREITVGNLATMRTGLESTSFGNYGSWVSSRDWIRNALERPLVDEPGGRRRYSTGDTHLLSAVLTAATGTPTLEFARRNLLEPLGIGRVRWERDPNGIYVGGNNLAMTARDLARFGQLYLDRGRWGEEQVVPWQWVDRSTRESAPARPNEWGRYGYLWWLRPPDERGAYTANGFGGQFLYLSPAEDLLVVIGASQTSKPRGWRRQLFGLIREGVVGSVETRTAGIGPPASPLAAGTR